MDNPNFFTNRDNNTLVKQFKGILDNNPNLKNFDAVVGFLRASGYFTLQPLLDNVNKVRILIGIDVDKYIVRAVQQGLQFLGAPDQVRDDCLTALQKDIETSDYKTNVEDGIRQMVEDMKTGKLELRAHPSKKIHAKIYILYPDNFNEFSTSGAMITGSSNLSGNGLGISGERQYEFNAIFNQNRDVAFAKSEFEQLWEESKGCPITSEAVDKVLKKTYLDHDVTPYELYIKMLIEYYGSRVEASAMGDAYSLPEGYDRYDYQMDAVEEGYQKLLKYNGFFLADVVGLGKTVIATMIAKKFLIDNGYENTKILVVHPVSVEANWKATFRDFEIDKHTKFISKDSLHKIVEEKNADYWPAEEYDLILVDEAHNFRSAKTNAFENLQQICKMPRSNKGNIRGYRKKVMLISATPMNNSPRDIYNQIQLFQDTRRSTIDGVTNLASFFSPLIKQFQEKKGEEKYDSEDFRSIANKVRNGIMKPITVRRTRTDIKDIPRYAKDLSDFPQVEKPIESRYELSDHLAELFEKAMYTLTGELSYARYQAIAFLLPEKSKGIYDNAELVSTSLAGIRKNGLVKRLESSFTAFKKSLDRFAKANRNLIEMFENNKVYITPDLDINALLEQGFSEEEIEEKINEKTEANPKNRIFTADDFVPDFIDKLRHDQELLDKMNQQWQTVTDTDDSKFDKFADLLQHELFSKKINSAQKLVVFSESVDTVQYLKDRIAERIDRKDILVVTSKNRKDLFQTIRENFDANYKNQKNDYNIILTTDVLAEGINLHRANVIVNYDTPWNATRLMQRIGRVNRIGSTAGTIYNYVFYPSRQGNKEIALKEISLAKIQTFISILGEDNKIYSGEEILDRNLEKLFDEATHPKDEEKNAELPFYEELRDLYINHRNEYERIKQLSPRARCGRAPRRVDGVLLSGDSLVFLKTNFRKTFYLVSSAVRELTAIDAFNYFKAQKEEANAPRIEKHHEHVQMAQTYLQEKIAQDYQQQDDKKNEQLGKNVRLEMIKSLIDNILFRTQQGDLHLRIEHLRILVERGTFNSISTNLERLHRALKAGNLKYEDAQKQISEMAEKYDPYYYAELEKEPEAETEQSIVLSESFRLKDEAQIQFL